MIAQFFNGYNFNQALQNSLGSVTLPPEQVEQVLEVRPILFQFVNPPPDAPLLNKEYWKKLDGTSDKEGLPLFIGEFHQYTGEHRFWGFQGPGNLVEFFALAAIDKMPIRTVMFTEVWTRGEKCQALFYGYALKVKYTWM